jgi:hypothetical protein
MSPIKLIQKEAKTSSGKDASKSSGTTKSPLLKPNERGIFEFRIFFQNRYKNFNRFVVLQNLRRICFPLDFIAVYFGFISFQHNLSQNKKTLM